MADRVLIRGPGIPPRFHDLSLPLPAEATERMDQPGQWIRITPEASIRPAGAFSAELASEVIQEARKAGIGLQYVPERTIKASGDQEAWERFRVLLEAMEPQVVEILRAEAEAEKDAKEADWPWGPINQPPAPEINENHRHKSESDFLVGCPFPMPLVRGENLDPVHVPASAIPHGATEYYAFPGVDGWKPIPQHWKQP